MSKLLVIVPAYNEQASIKKVVQDIKSANTDYDIIVVDDRSTDGTRAILENENICHLSLPINLGIGGAMQTGYKYAKENGYDFAVQVDGDGQHEPREIVKLLKVQQETGADLVIGSRFINDSKEYKQTVLRKLGIEIFAFCTKILANQKIFDATSGFRLANRNIINMYADYYPSDYPEPEVIVMIKKRGYKIHEVPTKMNLRETGKSSITPLRSVYYMIKVISSMLLQKVRD